MLCFKKCTIRDTLSPVKHIFEYGEKLYKKEQKLFSKYCIISLEKRKVHNFFPGVIKPSSPQFV